MPNKVQIKVPPLSGFDKSHQNLLTGKVGTLTPLMVDELIPNSKVDLKVALSVSLPPLASDTFMRCNYKVEAFFVPTRLLYGGFSDWLTGQKSYNPNTSQLAFQEVGIPRLKLTGSTYSTYCGAGSLMDYLGIRGSNYPAQAADVPLNIFPLLAYHRIYDDWYRAPLVQSKVFNEPMWHGGSPNMRRLSTLPFMNFVKNDAQSGNFLLSDTFDDGHVFGNLRQRNFGYDYFSCAQPAAQLGSAKAVSLSWASGATSTTMTIAALRAANSLQQFAERNQLAGYKLQDYVRANYGANLSTGVAQRAILLGSGEITAYSKGIYQTTPVDSAIAANVANPMAETVGAQFGQMECNGEINLVSNFTAEEPGILMVIGSLVPKVTYASGIDRIFKRYNAEGSQTDMATPILQNVGNQPIYAAELTGDMSSFVTNQVFGYTDRYADFKYKLDTLHGLVRDGQTLQAFALQRTLTGTPTISSSFLEIPTNYLDGVSAVSSAISLYGYWLDSFFRYRVSQPLAAYAIPSLQDPAYEHGKDVDVVVGGTRL